MPVEYLKTKPVKKKSGGGIFGSLGHVLHDVGHVISGTSGGIYRAGTGFPTGAFMAGRAILHDVRHDPFRALSPGYNLYRILHGQGQTGKLAHNIAKSEYEQYRHFGRGGDVSGPLFDALALMSGGGAAVGKAGLVTKAIREGSSVSKALRTPLIYERKIPGTEFKTLASPNPAVRALQKGAFHVRLPSIERVGGLKVRVKAEKTFVNKAIKRRNMQVERAQHQLTAGTKTVKPKPGTMPFPPSSSVAGMPKAATTAKTVINEVKRPKPTLGIRTLNAPMNILRTLMWVRPRYYAQNLAQTAMMLGTDPIEAMKAAKSLHNIKMTNPKLHKDIINMTGEGQALATLEGYVGPEGFMHKFGRLANTPEARLRAVSAVRHLNRRGYVSQKQMENAIAQLKSGTPSSRALNAFIGGNEDVADFGRLSKTERNVMKTQIPIFYPMFKALTRYGVRFPAEHSILTAGGVATGKVGKKEQERILGQLPFWAQYMIPKHAGERNYKLPKSGQTATFNPANIYNFQPALDITRQAGQINRVGGPIPGLSLLQEVGPALGIGYGLATGKDMQTGYPIKPFSKSTYKRHPGLNRAWLNTIVNYAEGLPLADLAMQASGQPPHVRSYVKPDLMGTLEQQLGLGPAFFSRVLKTKETQKQAKREHTVGRSKGRKKKGSSYGG